jgi:thiol-disulfide isomerase/thioredoxin
MNDATPKKQASRTGWLVLALVVILIAGGVLVRVVDQPAPSATTQANKVNTSGLIRAGNTAPNFSLTDPQGHPVSLDQWHGHPILINFWATWCGPCEIEMPAIQEAYKQHQDEGLVVLAIAVEEEQDQVEQFFQERQLTFQALLDDGTATRAYRVFGLPTSYFVAADGTIAASHMGMLTNSQIEKYLSDTLAER